jgi:hypothetical protein
VGLAPASERLLITTVIERWNGKIVPKRVPFQTVDSTFVGPHEDM